MDEKIIIKLSRKIEYLVHKRHRSFRHIQNAFSKEGNFWLNCVKINKQDILKNLNQLLGHQELKLKAERFYHLGFSLGKIIDLGNVINTVYILLQLFEEFETYIRINGASTLENNAILRNVLPQNIESFSKLQYSQEKMYLQSEDFRESLNVQLDNRKDNTSVQSSMKVDTLKSAQLQEESKGSPQQPTAHQYKHHHHQDEMKIDLKYKNPLVVYEQHYNNYDDYIMKTTAAGNLLQTENSIASKIHASKIDPKIPNFKVLSCRSVSMNLDYCEVSSYLLDMLIIVYNKMYDNQFLNPQMLIHVEKIDSIIMTKIVKVLSEDLNRVARTLAIKQLAKINKSMKLDNLPGKTKFELNKVPSDDDIFDIAGLDLDSNKQDAQFLNSAGGLSGIIRGNSESNNTLGSYRQNSNLNNM